MLAVMASQRTVGKFMPVVHSSDISIDDAPQLGPKLEIASPIALSQTCRDRECIAH